MNMQTALNLTPNGFELTEFTELVIIYRGGPDIVIEYDQAALNWTMRLLNVTYSAKTLSSLMTHAHTVVKTICTTLEKA